MSSDTASNSQPSTGPIHPIVTTDQQIRTACLIILTTLAVGAALAWLKPVFIPFVLAVFLTYCMIPVIDFLTSRLRFPKYLALATTLLLGALLLVIVGVVIHNTFNQMAVRSPEYEAQIKSILGQAAVTIPWDRIGISPSELQIYVVSSTQKALGGILGATLTAVLNVLSNGLLVLIFMFFLLIGRLNSFDNLKKNSTGLWKEVEDSIRSYLVMKVIISILTGFLHGLILWALGVEFAVVFGILAFLLNFIPNIGPVIATFMVIPALPISGVDWTTAALALALPGAVQFLSGNVIEPRIIGDQLDVHPVVVLLSLIFFGLIWGIVGMFLATQIVAVLKIVLDKFYYTKPLASILAGRLDILTEESPEGEKA